MIDKSEIERIIQNDLFEVLTTRMFYHYSDFDTSIDKILLKQTLRFSDPLTFNDPFDCNENLLKTYNTREVLENVLKNWEKNISREERRRLQREVMKPSVQADILKTERKKFKIACLSKVHNEVLMWSHYAKKHSGICIGFEFPHQYGEKFILCPVKYLTKISPIDGNTDINRSILYWLTTKSKRWDYEHEIRAITKLNSHNEYLDISFDFKFVKEIIFGCKVSDQTIKEAMSKIRKSNLLYKQITFKKMMIDENTLLLKDKIIKPSA
jgi:hypothetical protein